MNPSEWKTIKETFSAALELPPAERHIFLSRSNEEIRREVEKLLSTYKEAETFISKPFLVEKGLRENRVEENLIGKRIDDYVILEKLGEGGMGTVFLAEHRGEGFSQRVALKLIKRGMDTNLVLKRFLMERQILAGLEHPNIARLFGGGSTSDGLPYFVMEYVEGESIKAFCENHQLDTKERLKLFLKVCRAISYAHQNLVIHRDIKPSNIVVTKSGEPKLLDFGIAKLLSPDWNNSAPEPTVMDFRIMTPEYASPEQLRGEMTTTTTDVYSLGVVLYELLTGLRPFNFKNKNPFEISEAILTQEPIRPSCVVICNPTVDEEKNTSADTQMTKDKEQRTRKFRVPHSALRTLKGDLDNIILKAIRREPERRYSSVHELCEDIVRYLAGRPVKATADTTRYRLGKFIKRHRTGVFIAASFVFLLLVSTTVTGWQYFVARSERAKAEQHLNELRQVAKSLLTETNAALKDLPEGLEIRKSIVEKSVIVLDKLASEEKDDPIFLTELADAYDALGKIRHWNFHESRAALDDFDKALRLNEKAVRLAPRNAEIRKKLSITLFNIMEVYALRGDQKKMLEVRLKQRENSFQILALEPESAHILYELSAQTEEIAYAFKNLGQTAEGEEELRRSFDFIEKSIAVQKAKPFSLGGQVELVAFLMQKGSLLQQAKRLDEALAVYQTAADIAEKTYRADNSLRYAFNNTSRTHRLMADIYREKGDWQKFLEHTEFSINWLTQNLENKNLVTHSLRGMRTFYDIRAGIALYKLGQKRAGAARVDDGMNLYLQAMKSNSSDGEGIIYAPEMLELVSDFYVETNQTEKGVKIWQEFINLIEPFVAKNPEDTTSLGYLAYALERKGDLLGKYQKDKEAFAETGKSRLSETLTTYQQARVHYQKILTLDSMNQTRINQEKALTVKISRIRK